jgi:hypothetical protein
MYATEHAARAEILAEKLYRFASPTWSLEQWNAEVGKARDGFAAGKEAVETDGPDGAGKWVERAVVELKREGEEGEFWRDGRDLEELWEGV